MSASPFLSLFSVLIGIMPGFQSPRWDLAPVVLAPGEEVRVFLENPDSIPLFMDVEVRAQAISRARGPWETRKGEGALLCRPWKYHTVYLRVVLRLNNWQPVPVYHRLLPVISCKSKVLSGTSIEF